MHTPTYFGSLFCVAVGACGGQTLSRRAVTTHGAASAATTSAVAESADAESAGAENTVVASAAAESDVAPPDSTSPCVSSTDGVDVPDIAATCRSLRGALDPTLTMAAREHPLLARFVSPHENPFSAGSWGPTDSPMSVTLYAGPHTIVTAVNALAALSVLELTPIDFRP